MGGCDFDVALAGRRSPLTQQILYAIARDIAFGYLQGGLECGLSPVDDNGLLPVPYVCGLNMDSQAFLFAILRRGDCYRYFVAYPGRIACYLAEPENPGKVCYNAYEQQMADRGYKLWQTWCDKYGGDHITTGRITSSILEAQGKGLVKFGL